MAAPVLFTEAELNAILVKYKKYWDDATQIKDENILKNLDVTYLSSNHSNEQLRKMFKEFIYPINDRNDDVTLNILPINILSKTYNWNTIIYDKLLKLEDDDEIKFDNYIIIDLTNEIAFLYYNTDADNAIIKGDDEIIVNKLFELNNHNIFGIEFMLRRNYIRFINLNLYTQNLNNLEMINSYELFKIKNKHDLIDNLLNENNYYGLGRNNLLDMYNNNYNNLTSYKITYKLLYYIINIYKTNLDKLNTKLNFINNDSGKLFIINGKNKKIFMIGDIHGDFPRFVQILYNSGFIKFEGSVWSKIKMSDAESFKNYMHSSAIFKEVVWIPKNVLLVSTGDLVDSKRHGGEGDADATGDYELRIHLLILLLREQAIHKDSFMHFILGNHDRFLLQKFNIRDETSATSVNRFFNSYLNRYEILSSLYLVYPSSYAYIEIDTNKYIFTTHASFPKKIKLTNLNYNINIKTYLFPVNIHTYMNSNSINSIKDLKKTTETDEYLNKMELFSLLDEDRSTIEYFDKRINNIYNYDNSIEDNYKYIEILKISINELQNVNKLNKEQKISSINDLIDIFNNKIYEDALSNDNLIKNFPRITDDENIIIMHTRINASASDEQINNTYEILIKNIKYIFEEFNNISDITKSVSLNCINKLPIEPEYSVFGHQITSSDDFKKFIKLQTGYNEHHTILSVCAGKLNFIDVGLSEAFGKSNNVFFELFHFDAINSEIGRLRTYTSPNRYILGAPLYPELYYNSSENTLIPALKNGIPLVLEV